MTNYITKAALLAANAPKLPTPNACNQNGEGERELGAGWAPCRSRAGLDATKIPGKKVIDRTRCRADHEPGEGGREQAAQEEGRSQAVGGVAGQVNRAQSII